jgi:hypothetical protein
MEIIFRFGEARNANSVGMLNRIPRGKEIFGKSHAQLEAHYKLADL